jgi:hypothetical protein
MRARGHEQAGAGRTHEHRVEVALLPGQLRALADVALHDSHPGRAVRPSY